MQEWYKYKSEASCALWEVSRGAGGERGVVK